FDRKTYRKRVQVETVVSMIKRRLGNHVRARSRWGQVRELALVVLTHNLMILWCSILFYRAGLTPLISFAPSAQRRENLYPNRTLITTGSRMGAFQIQVSLFIFKCDKGTLR
ncbi:MAG: transposase, partial [Planctomycetota bacterium]